jgi:hypothetical protein
LWHANLCEPHSLHKLAREAGNHNVQFDEATSMRMKPIAFTLAAFPLALAGGIADQSVARAQEYRGTMEQQMACTPDVWRLCSDQIPDADRIVACLRQNTPYLSDGCRAVFQSNNSADPRQPPPRGRRQSPGTAPVPPSPPTDWLR